MIRPARHRPPRGGDVRSTRLRRRSRSHSGGRRDVVVAGAVAAFALCLFAVTTAALQHLQREQGASTPSGERPAPAPADRAGPETSLPETIDYTAMGDGYAAGGWLPGRGFLSTTCERAHSNLPARVAALVGVDSLQDVTCAGAATAHILHSQFRPDGSVVAPQIDAVHPGTDLVTIMVGANDSGAFQRIVEVCQIERVQPCHEVLEQRADSPLRSAAGLSRRMTTVLEQVQASAPEALVLVVGYPRIFPSHGPGCSALPMSASERKYAYHFMEEVNLSLRRAAKAAGVAFVDPRRRSSDHHVCSPAPWTTGWDPNREIPAWHPLPRATEGLAEMVGSKLGVDVVRR